MVYHESKIWTSAQAPCRTHYLSVERTISLSNAQVQAAIFANILQVSFLNQQMGKNGYPNLRVDS